MGGSSLNPPWQGAPWGTVPTLGQLCTSWTWLSAGIEEALREIAGAWEGRGKRRQEGEGKRERRRGLREGSGGALLWLPCSCSSRLTGPCVAASLVHFPRAARGELLNHTSDGLSLCSIPQPSGKTTPRSRKAPVGLLPVPRSPH